jgi:hypothetical protein
MELLIPIAVVVVALFLIVLPVQLAAKTMGAERTGFFWCLLALIAASVLHAIGLVVPIIGTIVAFFLSALGFSLVLDTDYLKGIGIAILHVVFGILIAVVLVAFFGVSLLALFG